MSALLLAEFREPESLLGAARRAKAARYRLVDVFSPFPVGGTAELLGSTSTRLRAVMFIGGFAVAACAYLTEVWSAVFNYPIHSGGRPLHSWPAFVLFPFAIGIFGAALAALIGYRSYLLPQSSDSAKRFAEPILKAWAVDYLLVAKPDQLATMTEHWKACAAASRPGVVLMAEGKG